MDSAGNITAQFVGDLLLKNGSTYQLITDHLGSIHLVVDVNTGDIARKMDYDKYGNVEGARESGENKMKKEKYTLNYLLSLMLFPFIFGVAQTNRAEEVRHTFLCSDYTQGIVCIISADGKLVWQYPAERSNDVWALPNGNILFNTGNGVKEVTRDKKVVFSYESKSEIYACQRLPNGDTFIGACNSGRLLEVAPDGKITKEIKLFPDSIDGGHFFMRNARKLENGNYLVAHYGLDKVCEYDSTGKIVMEIPIKGGPHSIIRLPQGNTLIACSDHNGEPKVVEVDKSGAVVWQLLKNELSGIELKFMTGMQLLPNGNLVLTNWLGHNNFGKAPHAFEITREKKVVWLYNDTAILKTMSSIQLMDSDAQRKNGTVLH